MSELPFSDVATAPWKEVAFSCGHVEWIFPTEYGDGSAWCSECEQVLDYDVAKALAANECADCGESEDCGPASVCAACGHCDWREVGRYTRKPITDDDWGWRTALTDDTVIALPRRDEA